MKKLESLKNEKFTVSDSELSHIKGGYDANPSIMATYTEYDTAIPGSNGGYSCDSRHSDSCIDF
jgi:hypothetical protein